MDFREFSGKTVEDAIVEAAMTLGIASSELEIEVVNKGTSGFLGIGAKPAVIKARAKKEVKDEIDDILSTVKKPSRTGKKAAKPAAKKPEDDKKEEVKETVNEETNTDVDYSKAEEKEEVPAEPANIDDSIIDETKDYLKKIFDAMELESTIDITLDKVSRTMSVDVEGPEMGIIIGKRGQTLDSLQYLVSLFVNKKSEDTVEISAKKAWAHLVYPPEARQSPCKIKQTTHAPIGT